MKTFEETLTAWIDDRLTGEERSAFEHSLAARPDAAALQAEKRDAARLRALLREHLPAMTPVLGQNADFFSHQLRERLAADSRPLTAGSARPGRTWWAAFFSGGKAASPARLLAAGTVCLLLAAAGIFILIPSRRPTPATTSVATTNRPTQLPVTAPTPATLSHREDSTSSVASVTAPSPSPTKSSVETPRPAAVDPDGSVRMANADTTRKDDPQLADIEDARVPAGTATSATAVHFDDQNADVLWLDGLEYQPDSPTAPGGSANSSPQAETQH